jgi:hypothetical protein
MHFFTPESTLKTRFTHAGITTIYVGRLFSTSCKREIQMLFAHVVEIEGLKLMCANF